MVILARMKDKKIKTLFQKWITNGSKLSNGQTKLTKATYVTQRAGLTCNKKVVH